MTGQKVVCRLVDECDAVVCIHKVPHVERDSCKLGKKMDKNYCPSYMSCGEVEEPTPHIPSRVLSVNGYKEIVRACWECPMHFTDFEPYQEYCALNNIQEFHASAHDKGFDDIITINNENNLYAVICREPHKESFHITCPLPEENHDR